MSATNSSPSTASAKDAPSAQPRSTADGYHARTDGFTSLAVVIGALGVWAGFDAADPIAGLIISIAILAVLRTAATDVLRRLMNGVDPALVDRLESEAAGVPGISSVHSVQVRWEGHRLQADLAIGVPPTLDVIEAHQLAHNVEHSLLHNIAHLDTAAVHIEPDGPERDAAHITAHRSASAPGDDHVHADDEHHGHDDPRHGLTVEQTSAHSHGDHRHPHTGA